MKVLLAENSILLREGLSLLIKSLFGDVSLHQVNDWIEVNHYMTSNSPDIILISHNLVGSLSWRYNIKEASLKNPNSSICLILGDNETIDPRTAYQLGLNGSINRETSAIELKQTIITMKNGGRLFKGYEINANTTIDSLSTPHLTDRQLEVLKLLKRGLSNKCISSILALSEGTVKQHLNRAYHTLHAKNRVEAINLASELGLV